MNTLMPPRPLAAQLDRAGVLSLTLLALTLGMPAARADSALESATKNPSICDFDLEQLMRVKVISVSKREEELSAAPAAIYVISGEDLQRSGVTTLADALRGVPGLDVARIDAHRWAVSSRGFNNELASKLLVLDDGRSVYTPLFSGVYWDTFDRMFEDVDRIEVIRGPGATLWGANAVNGVINLISKSAKDTQGLLFSAGGGTEEEGFVSARYGGKIGDNAYARVYGKFFNRDESVLANGTGANDDWWMSRGGFRVDWDVNDTSLMTFQGDVYDGMEHQVRTEVIATSPYLVTARHTDHVEGGNLLARWTRTFSPDSELSLQTYYDHSERESGLPLERRDLFDLDLQHRCSLVPRNVAVWGVGYRLTADDVDNSFAVSLNPDRRTTHVFSAFIQDEIAVVEDCLHLTLGTKLEHNDFTAWEVQPGARLAWTPCESQTFWASISRAVRTPSRAEDDVRLNFPADATGTNLFSILGDRSGLSEELIAYEIGYRAVLNPKVSVDLALFYNDYEHLRSLEPVTPPATPPPALFALASANNLAGETQGAELSLRAHVVEWWELTGSYTYLHQSLRAVAGFDATTAATLEGSAPQHQFSLRSQMNLPRGWQFDAGLRYVDQLSNPHVPSYITFDVRLAWQVNDRLQISVVGRDLAESQHAEFGASPVSAAPATEVERSVYGKLTWRF
ncbi:MAG: TonB-dependent receptor [Verrucomicrobia bacterium]|nr:MAG: TonB-dependent receptor [Verrucomicrobiota bacterium]